jgi:ADP-ribose pyrophosphatase YjhB (NUDIX family)
MTDPLRPPSFSSRVPVGDNRERLVCDGCGFVSYVNPKIVVGAVCLWEDKFLLCKRAIEPRKGYWTVPAGFMEERESVEEGAIREALEEAGADIEIGPLLGVYSVPRISQVHLMFVARMRSSRIEKGEESEEVRFFSWSEIPWDELAFPSVVAALRHFGEVRALEVFRTFVGALGERE